MEALIQFYTVVYDQQFSSCGQYLATADNYGRIAVFNVARAQNLAVENGTPSHVIKAHKGSIYSLVTYGQKLISGGVDGIKVWAWSEITSSSSCQPKATLVAKEIQRQDYEINSMAVNNDILYAGCGDSCVYVWDLQRACLKTTYSGHQDYIHAVSVRPSSNQLISASEDGSLCIWDTVATDHDAKPIKTLHPGNKEEKEFVTCVTCNSTGDWMACGGSMSPCVYHMSSLTKAVTLPVSSKVITQAVLFEGDRLITAGSERSVRHWSVNGSPMATIPSSQMHVFSLAANRKSHHKVLSAAGSSPKVDIYTNYGYKAFSLTVTDNK